MANKTYYKKGSQYVDVNGKAVMIAKGNQLTFTDYFNAGGGGELPVASASTLGGIKVGDGLNVTAGGVLSVDKANFITGEVDTGINWVDGKRIFKRVEHLEITVQISSSVATVLTGVNYIETGVMSFALSPATGATIPLFTYVQEGVLKAVGFSSFGATDILLYYTKPTPTEPAETNANTRTVKKTVKKG